MVKVTREFQKYLTKESVMLKLINADISLALASYLHHHYSSSPLYAPANVDAPASGIFGIDDVTLSQ